MKNIIVFLCMFVIVVGVYIFYHADNSIDPVYDEDMSDDELCEFLQSKWLRSDAIELDDIQITNFLQELIIDKGAMINDSQKSSLVHSFTSFLHHLRTGDFEDFMAFRNPDFYSFDKRMVRRVSYNHRVLSGVWDGLSRIEISPIWAGMSDSEKTNIFTSIDDYDKIKALHFSDTLIRFKSLRYNSVHMNIRKWKTKHADILNANQYYPDAHIVLHGSTPVRYNNAPIDVLKKYGGIIWARFRAAYDSDDYLNYVFPIQIALYWSPDDSRWIAAESSIVAAPKSVRGDNYTPSVFF